MSAAEKLEALEERAYRNIDDPGYGDMWCSEVRKALPQIVAVVVAAEVFRTEEDPADTRRADSPWRQMNRALAALDEALGAE